MKPLFALFLLFSLILTLSGCSNKEPYYTYAQKEHVLKQDEIKKFTTETYPMNSPTRDELRIMPEVTNRFVEKKPSESLLEWKKRIKEQYDGNHDLFTFYKQEFDQLDAVHLSHQKQLEEMRHINELLEKKIRTYYESPDEMKNDPTFTLISQKIPFTVHLVKKHDTLFSIANTYYGAGSKVKDIIAWNQGWIREPEKLMEGLCLVLFFDNEEGDRRQTSVNRYIREIQKQLDESLKNNES